MSFIDQTQSSNSSKFLVVGGSECGKTTLIDYFCNPDQKFNKVKTTVGCDIHIKDMLSSEDSNKENFVEFWDISGDDQYQTHISMYTKAQENGLEGFKGIIFFFDMDNIKTLSNINKYLKELVPQKKTGNKGTCQPSQEQQSAKIPLLIVGNKSDLIEEPDKENKRQKIKDQLDLIFDYDSSVKYIFTSKYSDYKALDGLQKFVEDCISEKYEDLYLFDASNGLCSVDKYKYFSKKTLDLMEHDLRRVQRYISTKTSHIYVLTAAVMLTLTFNNPLSC